MEFDMDKIIELITLWVSTYALKLLVAILILLIGRWIARKLSKLIARVMEKNNIDVTLISFLENLIYYTLLIVVIIAAVQQLGINTTSFLTIVGAAGLAVGRALKDSLSNFASGVMLILFRPFRQGDVVNAGGVLGKVEKNHDLQHHSKHTRQSANDRAQRCGHGQYHHKRDRQ